MGFNTTIMFCNDAFGEIGFGVGSRAFTVEVVNA